MLIPWSHRAPRARPRRSRRSRRFRHYPDCHREWYCRPRCLPRHGRHRRVPRMQPDWRRRTPHPRPASSRGPRPQSRRARRPTPRPAHWRTNSSKQTRLRPAGSCESAGPQYGTIVSLCSSLISPMGAMPRHARPSTCDAGDQQRCNVVSAADACRAGAGGQLRTRIGTRARRANPYLRDSCHRPAMPVAQGVHSSPDSA